MFYLYLRTRSVYLGPVGAGLQKNKHEFKLLVNIGARDCNPVIEAQKFFEEKFALVDSFNLTFRMLDFLIASRERDH